MKAKNATGRSLKAGTQTFCCLSHVVVDIVKTTVHPALYNRCNFSLPNLRPERSKNKELDIQPGFTKLGQVCHGKMYAEADRRFFKGFQELHLRLDPRGWWRSCGCGKLGLWPSLTRTVKFFFFFQWVFDPQFGQNQTFQSQLFLFLFQSYLLGWGAKDKSIERKEIKELQLTLSCSLTPWLLECASKMCQS